MIDSTFRLFQQENAMSLSTFPLPVSPYWPAYLPRHLVKPATTLDVNLDVAALRFAERTAVGFFGRDIRYRELKSLADRFADWLQNDLALPAGERVALYMQNSPHWLIAYYGALQAGAVVVPVNPMNRAAELAHLLKESGARVVVTMGDLAEHAIEGAREANVDAIVVGEYADYLPQEDTYGLPEWITARRPCPAGCLAWRDVMSTAPSVVRRVARPDDLALLNFTSGSTGAPKACMHTHETFMHTTVGLATWHGHAPGTAFLGVAPMYQVAGLVVGANCAVYCGGTIVPMPRWDRSLAAKLIARYGVAYAGIAPTALIDLLAAPDLDDRDLASLKRVSFGGASMPDSVWQRIHDRLGLSFIEAYGLTETAATTHINPIEHPRRQCLGLPFFDTDARVIDPETLAPRAVGEPGEIVMCGPQVFKGYWQRPEDTAAAFVEIDGQAFFRSGDIGYVDEDGYFFMTDRLKRMINASGFKVWPAEVESTLFAHPDIQEVCVVRAGDAYRGETVKAVVVLREASKGTVKEADIVAWARERMAAYKYPRIVEFVDALPKSPVGKILWRELEAEQSNLAQGDKA
jgi:fatty-acyl-CoA synthase